MELLDENIYVLRYPLKVMSCSLGRVVTVIRTQSGKTLIHSTAPFSEEEIKSIRQIGKPGWLLEATNFHDTNAPAGRAAFQGIPYLVPEGFPKADSLEALTIEAGTAGLDEEFKFIKIEGIPKLNEHAVFHVPSRTLILADLIFNLPESVGGWTKWLLKTASRIDQFPGQSAYFRHFIEDQSAYQKSIRKLALLDFNKIIFGHGEPIIDQAKEKFVGVLKEELTDRED